jgi:hypothetical protein
MRTGEYRCHTNIDEPRQRAGPPVGSWQKSLVRLTGSC